MYGHTVRIKVHPRLIYYLLFCLFFFMEYFGRKGVPTIQDYCFDVPLHSSIRRTNKNPLNIKRYPTGFFTINSSLDSNHSSSESHVDLLHYVGSSFSFGVQDTVFAQTGKLPKTFLHCTRLTGKYL